MSMARADQNNVDPELVRIGDATEEGAAGEGRVRRDKDGVGGASMVSFPLYPWPWPLSACTRVCE